MVMNQYAYNLKELNKGFKRKLFYWESERHRKDPRYNPERGGFYLDIQQNEKTDISEGTEKSSVQMELKTKKELMN